jgi:hypothetical protein
MTTPRDTGQALGLRRFGQTNSDPRFACGSRGFAAQDHAGPTLVTVGSGDRNYARASLPEQAPGNGTAELDRAPPTPGYLAPNQDVNAELKQHPALTLWRKAVPAPAALPTPNMCDPLQQSGTWRSSL